MAQLNQNMNKAISLLLALLLTVSLVISTVKANSPTVDTSLLLSYGFTEDELQYETVDGVYYIYTVSNGEASVINVHTTYRGSDKVDLTLPATLGGYPVTTIGDIAKTPEVFAYLEYDGDIDSGEYDPGLDYISKIVIPEGYEYIANYALRNFSDLKYEFPKSLKKIYGAPIEDIGVVEGELLVLPECEYSDFNNFYYVASFGSACNKIVALSRFPKTATTLLSKDNYNYSGEIYLPANLTASDLEPYFFYYEASLGESGEIIPTYVDATIHCAPDCEWLELFDKYTYSSGFTYRDNIVTDVVPATSIAFDSDSVTLNVGEYMDIEAKTYPSDALWTACDYVSSNPEVVKVDAYSGRITALKDGVATITATHCERGFTDSYTVVVGEGSDEPTTEEPTTHLEHSWSSERTYDENNHWFACVYDGCTETDRLESHSGGTSTLNAKPVCEVCGASYGKFKHAVTSAYMVGKEGYFQYGNRQYNVIVAGKPDKIQIIRPTGATVTVKRSSATIETIGNDEIWTVVLRLNKGTHQVIAKYGKTWNTNGAEFYVSFDEKPSCYKYQKTVSDNGVTTLYVVTDKEAEKIRFVTPVGTTSTYTRDFSYVGEDGLRHWTVTRKFNKSAKLELRLKYNGKWVSTAKYVTV